MNISRNVRLSHFWRRAPVQTLRSPTRALLVLWPPFEHGTKPNIASVRVFTEKLNYGRTLASVCSVNTFPLDTAAVIPVSTLPCVSSPSGVPGRLSQLNCNCKGRGERQGSEGKGLQVNRHIAGERKVRTPEDEIKRGRKYSQNEGWEDQEFGSGISGFHLEGMSVKWQLLSTSRAVVGKADWWKLALEKHFHIAAGSNTFACQILHVCAGLESSAQIPAGTGRQETGLAFPKTNSTQRRCQRWRELLYYTSTSVGLWRNIFGERSQIFL